MAKKPQNDSTDSTKSSAALNTDSAEVAMSRNPRSQPGWFGRSFSPFRTAAIRGLAVLLPPLLTIIFFVWAWNAIDRAILKPVESLAKNSVTWWIDETLTDNEVDEIVRTSKLPGSHFKEFEGERIFFDDEGTMFVKIKSNWIPLRIAAAVRANPGDPDPQTAREYYLRFVQIRYLKRHLVIPAVMALFLAIMYLVGKLLAAGIGRFFYHAAERIIHRLPIIRNVYSSVKQVTDFVFDDNEIQFTRVVAVEYPRRGVWSMGFVTGDSLLDIRNAAGEPMLSVLMPTSPMPATGFTISVPKSETVDLDITIDQAIQFCVSCGVVVPDHQLSKAALEGEVRRRVGESGSNGMDRSLPSKEPGSPSTTKPLEP
jgi:uncharacterized membrane protein